MALKSYPLGEVAEINPRMKKNLQPTLECSFVPMDCIDEQYGKITHSHTRPVSEVLKGYTPFEENDVLFAKITPCMENGKAAIAKQLVNGIGFGTTEFHVIRAKEDVLPEWLFYFIHRADFRKQAERRMTGSAGQKRVPEDFLEEVEIPLPSLDEQRRIARILDQADRLRRLRRYARQQTDTFLQSVFIEMFGDPFSNPKSWKVEKFGNLGDLDRGRSKHRPRNAPELLGGPYPLIQTGDVANSDGYIKSYSQTYSELGLAQSKLWPKGTLCITIAANIAKTAILTFPACFPDSIVGFTPGIHVTTEYIQCWLSLLQKYLEDTAPESAQKNINLEILRSLNVPLPPLDMQKAFAKIVLKNEELNKKQQEAERQAEMNFQALLHRAFSGQLLKTPAL